MHISHIKFVKEWKYLYFFFFFLLFGHAGGMWKFPGQGSNLSYSCNQSHSSDNNGSLTY